MPRVDLIRDAAPQGNRTLKQNPGESRVSITVKLPAALIDQLPDCDRGDWIEVAILDRLSAFNGEQ